MRKILVGLSAALLVAAVAAPAIATKPYDDAEGLSKGHKVTICHALPESASHKYNVITVDIASSGYVKGGHHRGVDGGLEAKHADGGDIIPPYYYEGKKGVLDYPGQNYEGNEQLAYDYGCGPEPDEPDEPQES